MLSTVTEDSIDYAIRKLKEHVAVNFERDHDGKLEALDLLCESVGLSEENADRLFSRAETTFEEPSYVFVGTLVGLLIAEYMDGK